MCSITINSTFNLENYNKGHVWNICAPSLVTYLDNKDLTAATFYSVILITHDGQIKYI